MGSARNGEEITMKTECDKCGQHALECTCLPNSKTIVPEMCECGRLYKDRRDKDGKVMCSACYCNCSVENLKLLWGTPVPDYIKNLFT